MLSVKALDCPSRERQDTNLGRCRRDESGHRTRVPMRPVPYNRSLYSSNFGVGINCCCDMLTLLDSAIGRRSVEPSFLAGELMDRAPVLFAHARIDGV